MGNRLVRNNRSLFTRAALDQPFSWSNFCCPSCNFWIWHSSYEHASCSSSGALFGSGMVDVMLAMVVVAGPAPNLVGLSNIVMRECNYTLNVATTVPGMPIRSSLGGLARAADERVLLLLPIGRLTCCDYRGEGISCTSCGLLSGFSLTSNRRCSYCLTRLLKGSNLGSITLIPVVSWLLLCTRVASR